MKEATLKQAGRMAYREALPEGDSDLTPAICLHGFPESSYMWRYVLEALAATGRRGLARLRQCGRGRILEALRHRGWSPGDPRPLPLRRLRETRRLQRPARRARPADPDPVGRQRRLRARCRRLQVPQGDPRREARPA